MVIAMKLVLQLGFMLMLKVNLVSLPLTVLLDSSLIQLKSDVYSSVISIPIDLLKHQIGSVLKDVQVVFLLITLLDLA